VKKQACVARQCTRPKPFIDFSPSQSDPHASPLVGPASAALDAAGGWAEAQACAQPGASPDSPDAFSSPLSQPSPPLTSLGAAETRTPFKLEDGGDGGSASTTASTTPYGAAPYPLFTSLRTGACFLTPPPDAGEQHYDLGLLGRIPCLGEIPSSLTILSFAAERAEGAAARAERAYAAEPSAYSLACLAQAESTQRAPSQAVADRSSCERSPRDFDWPASPGAERRREQHSPKRRGSTSITLTAGHMARRLGGSSVAVDAEYVQRLARRPFKPDRERRRAGSKQGYYSELLGAGSKRRRAEPSEAVQPSAAGQGRAVKRTRTAGSSTTASCGLSFLYERLAHCEAGGAA
jgi:hypothetical protein